MRIVENDVVADLKEMAPEGSSEMGLRQHLVGRAKSDCHGV